MQLIKLKFTSPLHLSRGKSGLDESYDVLHSDTLKSALFICAMQLYDNQIDRGSFLEKFTISSGFPFNENELFFPKPALLPDTFYIKDDETEQKKVKKIKYISQFLFENLLQGNFKPFSKNDIYESDFLSENKDFKKPFQNEVVQRVTVSRTYENEGDTFYMDRIFFNKNCGLFVLLNTDNQEVKGKIKAAFRLLGDNGIGSDKSVGNGQFEMEWIEDFDLSKVENATHCLSLSLYLPGEKEINSIDLDKSAYSLIKRGGYIANPNDFNNSVLRKKSIYMFSEGAVFSQNADLQGNIADLNPTNRPLQHEIWRDGKALFLDYKC